MRSPANRILAGIVLGLIAFGGPAFASAATEIKDPDKRKEYYKELAKGELSALTGKWEEARAAYRNAIRIAPEPVEAHQGYQDAMIRLGESEEVVRQYRDKLSRQPKNPAALYLLGRVTQNLEEKEKLFNQALELDKDYAWAHYGLGHLYEHLERWDASEAAFKRVIELRPRWAEGHNGLGFCYLQQGKKDDAAEVAFQEALKANPRFVDAMVNLAALALRRKQYDQAVAWCKKTLETDKTNPQALNNMGKALYEQGMFREALESYKKALDKTGADRPEVIYLNMGFCYYKMREWAQAAAAYERAISINPDFAYGYYCLAQARFRQEQYKDAWQAVHKAKTLGHEPHERFLKMLRDACPEPPPPKP